MSPNHRLHFIFPTACRAGGSGQERGGTFEEAVLAVHHVDASPLQAGGAVNLAVVLVEPAVRAAHRHEGGPALFLAHALGAAGFRHQHALSTPPAVGPPTGTFVRVREGWRTKRKRGTEKLKGKLMKSRWKKSLFFFFLLDENVTKVQDK